MTGPRKSLLLKCSGGSGFLKGSFRWVEMQKNKRGRKRKRPIPLAPCRSLPRESTGGGEGPCLFLLYHHPPLGLEDEGAPPCDRQQGGGKAAASRERRWRKPREGERERRALERRPRKNRSEHFPRQSPLRSSPWPIGIVRDMHASDKEMNLHCTFPV